MHFFNNRKAKPGNWLLLLSIRQGTDTVWGGGGSAPAQSRFEAVLNSMFGQTGDGVTDHLMSFFQAVTGSYWFTPSEGDLEKAVG